MTILALLLASAAFTLFALATQDLHQRFFRTRPVRRRQRRLRLAAWAALLLALLPSFAAKGPVFGPIWWAGLVMLAAALVFLTVNFWPGHGIRSSRNRQP